MNKKTNITTAEAESVQATPVHDAAVAAPAGAALGIADAALLADVVARDDLEAEREEHDGKTVVDDGAPLLHAVCVEFGQRAQAAEIPAQTAVERAA